MSDLDALLDTIDALELDTDEVDTFPWCDAAVWSPGDEYGDLDEGCGYGEPGELACNPWEVPGRVIVLSARLGDGRGARWSMLSGWSGDECAPRRRWRSCMRRWGRCALRQGV